MRTHLVVATVGIAILNGIFSPAVIGVFALHGLWYPFFLPASLPLIFLFTSLIVATLTLMISGIPAALHERWNGSRGFTSTSAAIWLGAAALLSLPALPNVARALA